MSLWGSIIGRESICEREGLGLIEVIVKLEFVKDSQQELFMIEQELAQRVLTLLTDV